MKRFLFAAAGLLALLVLSSCTNDAYNKGEGKYSLLRADMVELSTDTDGRVVRVVTDENDTLRIMPFTVKGLERPDTLYRAYLYYNIRESEDEPVSIGRISTLAPHRIDTLKTDPVRFESMWMSTSRRYLNMALFLMTGATDDDARHHAIGLAIDTLLANADGTHTLHLDFYHDQGGVPDYYSQRVYVSIPTDSLAADTVYFRINTYDGVVEKRF